MTARRETGDCRDVLRRLISEGVKVQMCVTSPPYWGLRDYGTGVWEGGDEGCDHIEASNLKRDASGARGGLVGAAHGTRGEQPASSSSAKQYRHTCAKCGARRFDKQIGLESTPEEYLTTMVEVFRLVREVLAYEGTLWLNMGDSYNAKDLIGMPWRLAFALQSDGWYLRSDIIWHKPNPMPESVTDRPTKAHEYVFMLTKGPRYYYDADAVREPNTLGGRKRIESSPGTGSGMSIGTDGARYARLNSVGDEANGRNCRTVWTIASDPFKDAHFATFPRKLVEPCILAGTSERGHCPECGARWVRVVEKSGGSTGKSWHDHSNDLGAGMSQNGKTELEKRGGEYTVTMIGWRPSCVCPGVDDGLGARPQYPVPDIVLDPFLGSGTVAEVAQHLGRGWIGIDLNPAYEPMQRKRTAQQGMALV